MPRYQIIVTRDVTESTLLQVDASNEEEAQELALHRARNGPGVAWEPDESSWGSSDPYVTDVEKIG